jgi:hypothetical protein
MYEKPKLNCVGDAKNVILGIVPSGSDLDQTYIWDSDEFAFDGGDIDATPARI